MGHSQSEIPVINIENIWPPDRVRAERATRLFEELCTPLNAFPDSPELAGHEHDDTVGVWLQIISYARQAKLGGVDHHTWPETERVALAATADLLVARGLPLTDPRVIRFTEVTGSSLQEFLKENFSER